MDASTSVVSEFDLIRTYFTRPTRHAVLGVGDDCALLQVQPNNVLAVSTDMLIEGRHFFAHADPRQLGHKCLAVNLSDLAAMGATPRWATLALALPAVDTAWLREFSAGLFALANRFELDLVGGDTTRGPLAICITIAGEVPAAQSLRRAGARVGDALWVSGSLGGAALALQCAQGAVHLNAEQQTAVNPCLHTPEPRVALGLALRGIATAAIDLSDGLCGDLGHVLTQSGVGATIAYANLPRHPVFHELQHTALEQQCVLAGGDDYELLFTAPSRAQRTIEQLAATHQLPLTQIGMITSADTGLVVRDAQGQRLQVPRSFDHFA